MQTQVPQASKKNKVTVPFYSPSYRLYDQTSADIIKEARAAVMTTSPVGIKPVFTSRPFTPHQKERTLFGNVKKSKSRPPSSFSLRPAKNQEPGLRVKLPSISVPSRRKDYSLFNYSKNLSLDNLTEDYDAELSEEVSSTGTEKFPLWKKSHSCPKEGRLSKVASLNDINYSFLDLKNNRRDENLPLNKRDTSEVNNLKLNYLSKANHLFGDYVDVQQVEVHTEPSLNPVMTKGGGDYEAPKGDTYIRPMQKNNLSENEKTGEDNEMKHTTDTISTESLLQQEYTEESKSRKEEPIETKEEKNHHREDEKLYKNENVSEKSIITGIKSEYLTSLNSENKNTENIKQPQVVPLEILQLYETAKYYGVDVDKSEKSSSRTASSRNATDESNDSNRIKVNLKNLNVEKKSTGPENHKTKEETSENMEFVMNNNKRYHFVRDKGETKEKAYKKWNNKQESVSTVPEGKTSNDGWDLFWKNSYYTDKEGMQEKSKSERENLLRQLSRIDGLSKKGADKEIYKAISELYSFLKSSKLTLDSHLKEGITRAIYLYVDNENAEVLLSLAKVFFLLKDENSLSVACKIIFKVARFDTNDQLFLSEEDVLELFLEGIGRASPLDCAESCIYSYGALKFLTVNHGILSKILHLGALDLMTLHLKMINNAYTENGIVGEQTQHVLFQLTGALRHVAAGEGALPLFLTTNCIGILCHTLRYFYKDEDVTVNISRTLSLLSTDEIVTQALMQVDNILTTLIDLMDRYKENDKILIRLAFCLGNIVEHSDLARVQVSRSDASLTVLLNVLKLYIDKDLELSLNEDSCSNSDELNAEVVDDVIVKVIRIIANMSMNPIVGSNLSPAAQEKKSLQLSKLLSVLLTRKDPGITLLATLGCLNNISYYCNTHSALVDITQGVERVLGLESVECQIESARVLGNLTRHREIRDLIYSTGGVELLIKLLSSPDQEVVRCACGALVNMLLDSETRKSFVEAQGIDKLVRALEVFPGDWSLASLATRAIWNACGDDVSSAMLHNNVEHLLSLLASSLEEENWNDGDITWEEFASVATDLLEKISSHLEST